VDYFKLGDLVIINNRVFRVEYISTNKFSHIPDGFLREKSGAYHNPKFCRRYEGAESVLEGIL